MTNTKTASLILMSVLLIEMFASTFVLAEEADISSAEEVAIGSAGSDDVQNALADIAPTTKEKPIGFVIVHRGVGWMTNSDDGHLINGFWATGKVSTDDSKEVMHRAGGSLHISEIGNFKLLKVNEDSDAEASPKISFYLVPKGKYSDLDEARDHSIGTLTLTKESSFKDFAKWSGSLVFDEEFEGNAESVSGSWNVEIATDTKRMNPRAFAAVTGSIRAEKVSFWNKLAFWKRNQENFNNPSNAQGPNNFEECTEEAKVCPDGSTVGRNPNKGCQFDSCPRLDAKAEVKVRQQAKLADVDTDLDLDVGLN